MIELRMELLGVSTSELLELEKLAKGELKNILKIGDCDRKHSHKGHRVHIEVVTSYRNKDARPVTFTPLTAISKIFQAVNRFPVTQITADTERTERSNLPKLVLPEPGMEVLIDSDFFRYMPERTNIGDITFVIEEVCENYKLRLREPREKDMWDRSKEYKEGIQRSWKYVCEKYPDGVVLSDQIFLIAPAEDD